ncbi:MAG TPA: FecR family protein [Planctomicrobium sp.]|nr:FecR family protein [Planctomicrobium sp.]
MTAPRYQNSNDNEALLKFIEQVLKFQDGTLDAHGIAVMEAELNRDPARRRLFIQLQDQSTEVRELLRRDAFRINDQEEKFPVAKREKQRPSGRKWPAVVVMAGLAALPLLLFLFRSNKEVRNQVVATVTDPATPKRDVIMEEGARALFFGRGPVAAGSSLAFLKDYMLLEGMVKVSFPDGATAIIEAPAHFRILDDSRLAMNTGACSVYAPDGAEGFQVVTPMTKVVDRGTRFSVKVHDNSETEVHVIEGAADLYSSIENLPRLPEGLSNLNPAIPEEGLRLNHQESVRIGSLKNDPRGALKFDPNAYHKQLPDRVISYKAKMESDGVDELQSVTVRRGGITKTYPVDDLIPIQVTWFRADSIADTHGHLAGDAERPARPEDWLEDRRLKTGIINAGGQPETPEGELVMVPGEQGTRGLGFRFAKPVVNGPGPDVVFFEIQCLPNLLDGDPFHVIPVQSGIDRLRPELRSHTVRAYDLTLNSPEALPVKPFYLHRYPEVVNTLEELTSKESQVNAGVMHLQYYALVVGLDLSDLGYQEGEQVTELFLQHAAAGKASRVDFVFIAGLPADEKGTGR